MARRLFVCVVCAFRGNRFNIERHVWIRHVRGTIPGMQEEPYNAAYKEQVLKYLQAYGGSQGPSQGSHSSVSSPLLKPSSIDSADENQAALMRTSTSPMHGRPLSASHDHPLGFYGKGAPLGCAATGAQQHHSHPHLAPLSWDGAEAGHYWRSYPGSNPRSVHGPPGSGAAPMPRHIWPEEPPSPSSRSWSAGDCGHQIPLKKASSSPLTSPYERQPRFSPYSPTGGATIHRKSPFSRARSELPLHSEAGISDKYGLGELEHSVPQQGRPDDDGEVTTTARSQNRSVTQLHPSKFRTGVMAAAVEDVDEEVWRPWS